MAHIVLLPTLGQNRTDYIKSKINREHKILEIGGSYNPIFRRSQGYRLWTADHDTQDGLIAKYTDANVDGAQDIEPVDFVVSDGNLSDAIPDVHHHTFDFVLSSHNIEHIPNPILHLQSIERFLTTNGTFLTVVPDKRGCFDLLRPLTMTGRWLEAYLRSEPFHSPSNRFENDSYLVANHGSITWHAGTIFDGLSEASGRSLSAAVENALGPVLEYRDGHAWCFTPHSALLIFRELHAVGLTKLYPYQVLSDGNGEFIVELVPRSQSSIQNSERIRLLALACREQAEAHLRIDVDLLATSSED